MTALVLVLRGRCDGQVSRLPSLDMCVMLVVQSFPVRAGLKFRRLFGREGWEGQVIRWTKKEGGHGRVLWIEESSAHPRSGSEHGRSAQQELLLEWGVWAGTPATYLLSTPVQTPSWRYVSTYLFCCAPSSPGRRGAVPGFSWQSAVRQSHPIHTDGWVGGLEMQLSGPALACPGRPGALPLAAGFFLRAQFRLPEM